MTDPAERKARGLRDSDNLRSVEHGSRAMAWWRRQVRRVARLARKREDRRNDRDA